MSKGRLTTSKLRKMKEEGIPIAMMTAYDYPSAKLVEEAGMDLILVGDSLGMAVLGYDSTIPVTVDDMVHHTKAVTRGARNTFVVTDMPFLSYHGDLHQALQHAGRIMQQGLAHAVKLEGGREIVPVVEKFVAAGIPVMGHLGLTPQSVHQLGGYKVQGKTTEQAGKLIDDAKALEASGAFAIVLECVPDVLASIVTKQLNIPTIGIGAGRKCDGQVLVFHDVVQYASEVKAKFVKSYVNIGEQIQTGVEAYIADVKAKAFPEDKHTFHMEENQVNALYGQGAKYR
jgi:3-methyl-2-oxobutanoate hydroxymethyltransferase